MNALNESDMLAFEELEEINDMRDMKQNLSYLKPVFKLKSLPNFRDRKRKSQERVVDLRFLTFK
jgi:hypothetical protein